MERAELELIPERPTLRRAVTLANLIDEFVSTALIGVGAKEQRQNRGILEDFILFIDGRELSPKLIGRYAVAVSERWSAQTVWCYMRVLRRFFKWCFTMRYTKDRWNECVPTVRMPPLKDPVIITQDEYERILEACKTRDQKWIITLAHSTGMRLGDCCTLLWENVDLSRQIISWIPRKNRKSTGKKLHYPYETESDLYRFINELQHEREDNPVLFKDFVCQYMGVRYGINPCNITTSFKVVFQRAGITGKTFRHFRSTFESRMANSGMNIAMAASIMGRSDTSSILRYVRPDMEVARAGIARALDLHNHVEGFK